MNLTFARPPSARRVAGSTLIPWATARAGKELAPSLTDWIDRSAQSALRGIDPLWSETLSSAGTTDGRLSLRVASRSSPT